MTKKKQPAPKPQEPPKDELVDVAVDFSTKSASLRDALNGAVFVIDDALEPLKQLDWVVDRLLNPRHLKACSRPLCADLVVAVLDSADGAFDRLCERHYELVRRVLDLDSPPINDPWRREFEQLPAALQYGLEGR